MVPPATGRPRGTAAVSQQSWRLFFAVQVPEAVKDELQQIQARLQRAALPGARWTPREQLHLTLRFLGNVEARRLDDLLVASRAVCRGFLPLELRATQIGFFPPERPPRVVWAGVKGDDAQLGALQHQLQHATLSFTSEAPEPRFVAHITLARLKTVSPGASRELHASARRLSIRQFGAWTATGVALMRSELEAQGAHHSEVVLLPLGAARGTAPGPA
jgi:2'-5' RNA ligase